MRRNPARQQFQAWGLWLSPTVLGGWEERAVQVPARAPVRSLPKCVDRITHLWSHRVTVAKIQNQSESGFPSYSDRATVTAKHGMGSRGRGAGTGCGGGGARGGLAALGGDTVISLPEGIACKTADGQFLPDSGMSFRVRSQRRRLSAVA